MTFRPDIIAGRAVILVNIQDTIDKQLRGIRTKFRRFANSMSDLGGDLFRFGAVGSIGAFFPVRDFVAFQDQLLFIQTKLQATDSEMLGLEMTIRQLGKSTSFTSQEVGQAAQQFAQAGFSLTEIQSTLQASLDLSRGGGVDLATSTTILANSLRTFQRDASDAALFASKFITAARLGTLDIIDLNESLKESSGTFRLLNVGIDESLALITQLSLSSLKGTKAGTSLNTAFLNLASSADILNEKLGITVTDSDLERPLQLFTKLQDAVQRLGRQETVTVLREIFNIRGGRAAGAILIQGLDSLDDRLKQIRASTDEARTSAAKLDSQLGGVGRRALSAFQELLISIGATSEGPLTRIGEAAAGLFNGLSKLAQVNPQVFQTLLLIPPVTLAAGVAFLTMGFAVNKLASAMTPLVSLNRLVFDGLSKIVGLNKAGLVGVAELLTPKRTKKQAQNAFQIPGQKVFSKAINTTAKVALNAGTLVSLLNPRLAAVLFLNNFEDALSKGKFNLFKFLNPRFAAVAFLNTIEAGKFDFVKLLNPRIAAIKFLDFLDDKGLPKLILSIRKGLLSLTKVNYLGKIVSGATKLRNVLLATVGVLNTIRRFAFSFSGILTLVELLIIFGPKIPIIKKGLDSIATAFSKLFSTIGKTVSALKPLSVFFSKGFGNLFSGNFDAGIEELKMGFQEATKVLRTGLSSAWTQFVAELRPAIDKIKTIFNGLFELLRLGFESVVAVGGQLFGGIADILPQGDSGNTFSNENITMVLAGLGGIVASLASGIIGAISFVEQRLFDIYVLLKTMFGRLLQSIGVLFQFISPKGKPLDDAGITLAKQGQKTVIDAAFESISKGIQVRSRETKQLAAVNNALQEFLANLKAFNGTDDVSGKQAAAEKAIQEARDKATLKRGEDLIPIATFFGGLVDKLLAVQTLPPEVEGTTRPFAEIFNKIADGENISRAGDRIQDLLDRRKKEARQLEYIETDELFIRTPEEIKEQRGRLEKVNKELLKEQTGTLGFAVGTLLGETVGEFFKKDAAIKKNLEGKKEQVAPARRATETLVADFSSTRNNLVKLLDTRQASEEKQQVALDGIRANTREIADAGPDTFR